MIIFKAKIYVLRTEEGGRQTSFFNGYQPRLLFHKNITVGTYIDSYINNEDDIDTIYEGGRQYMIELCLNHNKKVEEYISVGSKFFALDIDSIAFTGTIVEVLSSSNK